jgi:hypothetical protein
MTDSPRLPITLFIAFFGLGLVVFAVKLIRYAL